MKALPKLLLALAAVAAFCIIQPAKANQITNPGFDIGNLTGWTFPPRVFRDGYGQRRLAAFRKLSSV